ncbi:MAG: FtsQ-type POTRA domain-containing protein [Luteitalea sp.]|nr:FtsQ-type POTRA domain-containing protein [Luteitalea sp.]
MSPVAVSADRRFHRGHVKPSRRRPRWRVLAVPLMKYATLAAVAALALHRGSAIVAESPLLQIDRIVVHGNQRLSEGEVLAVLSGLPGENLVHADLEAWRARLLAAPWVRDASLRRSLPSTVEVVVFERQAIGIGRIGGDLYLVDERGGVIDRYGPMYAELDLPIIDGLSAAPTADTEDDARARLAARLIGALGARPEVAKRVSQIDVRDLHNAAVILNGDPAVIYVGEDRFLPRLESYLELASALRERVAEIDYVDLRFDERIYVRPVQAGRHQE